MESIATELPGLVLLKPRRFGDERGWFAETWNRATFRAAGITTDFIQDNMSRTTRAGTVRGLHYQAPPAAQAKLIHVPKGRILDVVVDLRRGQPTYGAHLAVELSAEDGTQLFVPEGFAHGFCTLEPDVVVAYKVSAPYAPTHERVIHWRDPDLAIDWPVAPEAAILAGRDAAAPPFAAMDHGF